MLRTNFVRFILHKYGLLTFGLVFFVGLTIKTTFFNHDLYSTFIVILLLILTVIVFFLFLSRVQKVTIDEEGIAFIKLNKLVKWQEIESLDINWLGQYRVTLKDETELFFYGSGAEQMTFFVTLWEETDEIFEFISKMRLRHEFELNK